jgi:hypothetical protein
MILYLLKSLAMITEQEKTKILSGEEIEISSSRAEIQQYILVILIPIVSFCFFKMLPGIGQEWETGNFIALVFAVGMLFFMCFMVYRLTTVKIQGNKILLKKAFQKQEIFDLSDIEDIDTFRIKTATYLSILLNTESGQKRYWALKPSIFSEGTDVYELLYDAKFLHSK